MEKTACDNLSNEDLSSLPDSAFAYPVQFGDRYYPCHTPEHLTLSRAYLHKYPEDVPKETFGKIASYLEDAAAAFGLPPWGPSLVKKAEDPIDDDERLAMDALAFERGYRQMYLSSRREAANSLYERAESLNKTASLPHIVLRYARRHLSPNYMRAIDDRRRLLADGSPARGTLCRIGMDANLVDVETLLSALCAFDEINGLTAYYDDSLLDPYLGLLGDEPPPQAVVYRDGDCKIYEGDVTESNLRRKLKDVIGEEFIRALGLDFGNAIDGVRPEMKTVILRAIRTN